MMLAALLQLVAAANLRSRDAPVNLPFPDVKEAEAALTDDAPAPEPVEQAAPVELAPVEKKADDSVSAWHMPTLKPDSVVASADQFKHPTEAMLKDWETAPKIDMFEAPTDGPAKQEVDSPMEETAKKPEAALPAVQSQLHPVNPYGKRDDNAELAAIQRESPDAYGIIKALLMKKQMGLPLPGAEAAQEAAKSRSDMAGERQQDPAASTEHISNMWNWHPHDSASDELAATQEMTSTESAPAPTDDAPAPAAAEEAAPAPAEEAAPAPAEPTAAAAPATGGLSLSSWLGGPLTPKAAPVEQQQESLPAVPKQGLGLMSKYALDLE